MKKLPQCFGAALLALLLFLTPEARAHDYYISAAGDTLSALAAESGLSPQLLAAANDLPLDDQLAPGLLLTLPLEPLQAITVSSGDTLWSLAASYSVSVEQLLQYNDLSDPRRLYPGMTLYAPLPEEQAVFSDPAPASPALSALAARGSAMSWPAEGSISSRFGPRGNGWHYGLDIAADSGAPVRAALSGIVIEAGWKNDAYGYTVMLQHGNGSQTLYAHASRLVAELGDTVRQGQLIAEIGSTGNSTGPHLHFEVRVNHICRDPLEYLR